MLSHQNEFALRAKRDHVQSWSELMVQQVLVLVVAILQIQQHGFKQVIVLTQGPHASATPSPERLRSGYHTRRSQPLHWEDIVLIPRRIGTWLALSAPWVAQRASEFYSSVMLNKRQRILGARALNFLQSVRQLMAAPGPSGLLKYWKSSLDRWHHGEFTARVTCSAPYR